MAKDDFDIEGLARYLHLTPAQVSRMVDRGKLPGRRIAGQWRFARAEIHHWLEDRIGASDESELAEVEQVLDRQHGAVGGDVSLLSLIPPEAIAVPLRGKTRNAVIRGMVELAAATGLLWDPDKMIQAVSERESLHPTALDNGVALLHPRRPQSSILAEPLVALGRTPSGVPFGGRRLTDIFFLICSTDDANHLRILARISRLLASDPELVESLRHATDAAAMRELIAEAERKLG